MIDGRRVKDKIEYFYKMNSRKNRNKKQDQFLHAVKRFKERLEIIFTKKTNKEMVNLIRRGKLKFIEKQTNRIFIYEIKYDNKIFQIVYDKLRHQIITCLV